MGYSKGAGAVATRTRHHFHNYMQHSSNVEVTGHSTAVEAKHGGAVAVEGFTFETKSLG